MKDFKLDVEPEEKEDTTKVENKEKTTENNETKTESDDSAETKTVPIAITIETNKINLLNYVKTDDRSGIFTIPNTPWVVVIDKAKADTRPKLYNFKDTYAVGLNATNCYVSHDLKKKEIYYKYIIDENRFLVLRFASKTDFVCEVVSIENKMLTNYVVWTDQDPIDKVRKIKINFFNTYDSLNVSMEDVILTDEEKSYFSATYKINKLNTVKDALVYVGKKCKAGWHQNYLRRIFDIANRTWKNHF